MLPDARYVTVEDAARQIHVQPITLRRWLAIGTMPQYECEGIDYVLQFCPGDTKVTIGSLTNSSRDNAHLNLFDNTVNVTHNGLPPDASQPGTSYTLDTGDNRFENRSLQVGNRIINTATVSGGSSFAIPTYYNFNIGVSPHSLVSDGEFFALNGDVPTSLDGRYFGPLLLSSVIGRATPIWTVKDR